MKHIPESEIQYSDYSILDSFGRVFFWEDRVYRGLSQEGYAGLTKLRETGLLTELEDKALLPKTVLTDYKSQYFDFIVEHEKISPASFVYEWPFDMIKAAGNCILNINIIANKYSYQTIDAHPYNVMFKGCNPVFIDLGSFKYVENATHWDAVEEFYGYFKYPLNLWNSISYQMARRLYDEDLSCITTYEYNKLLELSTPAYKLKARPFINRVKNKINRTFNKEKTLAEKLTSYQNDLENLSRNEVSTQWGNYHDEYVINDEIITYDRFNIIINKINELKIETVTELAGNWGLLSYQIFKNTKVKHINCTDYDEKAVNKMFNYFKKTKYAEKISPAIIDFMKPIELCNSGRPSVRFQSEAVLALAVTHHLILTNRYDLHVIFNKIAEYSSKYVFIEFMPLGLWNGVVAPPIPDFYNQEWFTAIFQDHFTVMEITPIEKNRVLYVGTKKNNIQ